MREWRATKNRRPEKQSGLGNLECAAVECFAVASQLADRNTHVDTAKDSCRFLDQSTDQFDDGSRDYSKHRIQVA